MVDWAWFSSIGYVGVFWTALVTKAALFVVVFAVSTLILWANATLALRFASRPGARLPIAFNPGFVTFQASPGPWAGSYGLQPSPRVWRFIILAVAIILGLLIALGETGRWDLILRFIYQAPYGRSDPLFDKDIGFYLFSLPVYVAVKNLLLWILVLATLMAGSIYFLHDDISLDTQPWSVSPAAIAHGSALLGLFFAIKAWGYALDRYLLVYNDNGVVVGAGYTDVHVELPALSLLIVLAVVAAAGAFANVRLRTVRLFVAAALLVFGGSLVFAEVVPALFERFYVKPNELQLETPYIQRNIALTREAYNLGEITVKPFPAEQDLTFQSLKDDSGTVENIRLWDSRPLLDTYAQLQEIRTYYRFLDVDIDRYHLDGSYQQVMLSPRELYPSLLSANAQTWVNLHLLFTHGAGSGDVPGHPEVRRGLADLLPEGHPAGGDRRSADNRAAHLFRTKRRRLCDRQRRYARSSTIPREMTTPIRVTTARTASRSAGSPGGPCSPGISATSTSCSAATSPARARSCFIETSRIAWRRSRRFCNSTTTLTWRSAKGDSTGFRTPTPRAPGSPTPSRNPAAAISTTFAIQ